jgi:uncharacterized membrane protein
MSASQPASSKRDEDLAVIYRSAALVLRWGFRIAAAILAAGLLLALIKQEDIPTDVERFQDVIPTILDGKSSGVIELAILAMMSTPVATVLAIVLGFYRIGDRRFAVVSTLVLAVLAISISLSLFR